MATLDLQQGLPQRWLPDETLFSLCSRYHAASGNVLPATTCRQLFGHPRQGCAHDFPARLDHFLSVTGGALGTVTSIVEDHTVLPLYLRFASEETIDAARCAAAVSGGQDPHLFGGEDAVLSLSRRPVRPVARAPKGPGG